MASASFLLRTLSRRTPSLLGNTLKLGGVRNATFFTPAHEYIKVEGKSGTVGITDFAQSALGEIVFVDLPEVGETIEKGDSFGSVESVKAASDVYSPVTGTVTAVNEAITDEPGLVNESAEDNGWFIKIDVENETELEELLGPDAYKEHCETETA